MSRDPIRKPDWHQGEEEEEPGNDDPIFFEEPRTYGWSTLNGEDEYGYPSLEAAKEGYRLDIDAKGCPRIERPRADPRDPDHSRND